MERDPLRLVWRATPGLHLLAFALLGLCGMLVLAGIDLVRAVVDDLARSGAGAPAPLLRLAVPLPARIGGMRRSCRGWCARCAGARPRGALAVRTKLG